MPVRTARGCGVSYRLIVQELVEPALQHAPVQVGRQPPSLFARRRSFICSSTPLTFWEVYRGGWVGRATQLGGPATLAPTTGRSTPLSKIEGNCLTKSRRRA